MQEKLLLYKGLNNSYKYIFLMYAIRIDIPVIRTKRHFLKIEITYTKSLWVLSLSCIFELYPFLTRLSQNES